MTTLARKFESEYEFSKTPDEFIEKVEKIAVQCNRDYKKERMYWIFEDGSAMWLDSSLDYGVITNYGFHCDYEKL